jgi:hypothetical protein
VGTSCCGHIVTVAAGDTRGSETVHDRCEDARRAVGYMRYESRIGTASGWGLTLDVGAKIRAKALLGDEPQTPNTITACAPINPPLPYSLPVLIPLSPSLTTNT